MKTSKKCINCNDNINMEVGQAPTLYKCDICGKLMCAKCWHDADIIQFTAGFKKVCKRCLDSNHFISITRTVVN